MTAQEKADLIFKSLPAVNLSAEKLRQLGNVAYTLDQAGYFDHDMLSMLDYYRIVCMVLSGGYKEEFRL